MSTKDTLIFLIIAFAVAVLTTVVTTQQVNLDTLIIFGSIAVPILISYYFSSRKAIVPSNIEKTAASIWLFVRRLVCFSAAIFFGALSILLVFFAELSIKGIGASLASIVVAAICIWVAVYGQGWNRSDWKDDVALHKQNKARYKWPW